MNDHGCTWCGGALTARAEVSHRGETTIVCACPRDGEYAILPSLAAVLDALSEDERRAIQARLEARFAATDSRIDLTRTFVEGIIGRSLEP